MKKILMTAFICFGLLAKAENITEIDTTDIRKYHQQLEEQVFELEEEKTKMKKYLMLFFKEKEEYQTQ